MDIKHLEKVINTIEIQEHMDMLLVDDLSEAIEELAEWKTFKEDIQRYTSEEDWEAGIPLIHEGHFVDYFTGLMKQKYNLDRVTELVIDWDETAESAFINNWEEVGINGEAYYVEGW